MSKRAQPAASASSSSAPASHFVRYEREDDGSRKLAEHFVKFVAEQMLGGMDRAERLSFAPFQLGLDDSHVEVLENVGVIKRKDNTFLAERGDIFYVPAAERDRCAREGDAVRELEGRIELVWQEPAAVEERPHQAQRLVEKAGYSGSSASLAEPPLALWSLGAPGGPPALPTSQKTYNSPMQRLLRAPPGMENGMRTRLEGSALGGIIAAPAEEGFSRVEVIEHCVQVAGFDIETAEGAEPPPLFIAMTSKAPTFSEREDILWVLLARDPDIHQRLVGGGGLTAAELWEKVDPLGVGDRFSLQSQYGRTLVSFVKQATGDFPAHLKSSEIDMWE